MGSHRFREAADYCELPTLGVDLHGIGGGELVRARPLASVDNLDIDADRAGADDAGHAVAEHCGRQPHPTRLLAEGNRAHSHLVAFEDERPRNAVDRDRHQTITGRCGGHTVRSGVKLRGADRSRAILAAQWARHVTAVRVLVQRLARGVATGMRSPLSHVLTSGRAFAR